MCFDTVFQSATGNLVVLRCQSESYRFTGMHWNLPKLSSLIRATPRRPSVSHFTEAPPLMCPSPALTLQHCGIFFSSLAPPSRLTQSSALCYLGPSGPLFRLRSSHLGTAFRRLRPLNTSTSHAGLVFPQRPAPDHICGPLRLHCVTPALGPALNSAPAGAPAPFLPVAFLGDQGQVPAAAVAPAGGREQAAAEGEGRRAGSSLSASRCSSVVADSPQTARGLRLPKTEFSVARNSP